MVLFGYYSNTKDRLLGVQGNCTHGGTVIMMMRLYYMAQLALEKIILHGLSQRNWFLREEETQSVYNPISVVDSTLLVSETENVAENGSILWEPKWSLANSQLENSHQSLQLQGTELCQQCE